MKILKVVASVVSAAIAVIFCWFGYDGARAGISANSGIVVLSGIAYFAYGLATLPLLAGAWLSPARTVRWLAALFALAPLAFSLAAFLPEGLKRVELISLGEIVGLLVLHVVTFLLITTQKGVRPL